jgi:putative intracellular protease/amidase
LLSSDTEVNKSKLMPFMLETKLKEQGAIFQAKANWDENVVVDGNLITGQNPSGSAKIFCKIKKKVG